LFETETNRKIKNPPALSMELEITGGEAKCPIFPGQDVSEEVRATGDIVAQFWTF
jgi:U3 small nucleolar RNA-associated protein 19